MNKMINLIRNENMKLSHSISTWIMMGILVLLIVVAGLIIKFSGSQTSTSDWKANIIAQNQSYKESLEQPGVPEIARKQIPQLIQTNEYRLENDIPPIEGKSLWGFVGGVATSVVSLIALFAIVMGGRVVANEFSGGTIKLLLIRPAKRWKILLAKYISVIAYTLLMLLVMLVFSFLLGGLLFSFKGATMPFLENFNGVVKEVNMVSHVVQLCLLQCVNLVMMVTLAFMISTVFRNSGLAIGIGVFLLTVGNMITVLLSPYEWSKFILFANTDLSQYIDGQPIVEGMTLTFSIVILIAYFVLFNTISFFGFTKRDITL